MFKLHQGFEVYGEDRQRYPDFAERKIVLLDQRLGPRNDQLVPEIRPMVHHLLDCSGRGCRPKVSATFVCDDSAFSLHRAAITDHTTMLNSLLTILPPHTWLKSQRTASRYVIECWHVLQRSGDTEYSHDSNDKLTWLTDKRSDR